MNIRHLMEGPYFVSLYEQLCNYHAVGLLADEVEVASFSCSYPTLEFAPVQNQAKESRLLRGFCFEPSMYALLDKSYKGNATLIIRGLQKPKVRELIDHIVLQTGFTSFNTELEDWKTMGVDKTIPKIVESYTGAKLLANTLDVNVERAFGSIMYMDYLNSGFGFSEQEARQKALERFQLSYPNARL